MNQGWIFPLFKILSFVVMLAPFMTPAYAIDENAARKKKCSMSLLIGGFTRRLEILDSSVPRFVKASSQVELGKPIVGEIAQIEVLRGDGLFLTYLGQVQTQSSESFALQILGTGTLRTFEMKDTIRVVPIRYWTEKSGLLFFLPNSTTTRLQAALGVVSRIDLEKQEIYFLESSTKATLTMPLKAVYSFLDLSSVGGTSEKTSILYSAFDGAGQSGPALVSDLFSIDWAKGELVFSHPANFGDLSRVRVQDLSSFHPYF